jgi:hypothetical protein
MQFQLAPDVFEKTTYKTIDATNLIESIKSLKIPNQGVTHKNLVENYGSQFCDLTKQIKNHNPYLFPYSVKDPNEKLIASNIDKLQFLVLDIDDSCSIKQFIELNKQYKYYLHTTTTHQVSGIDKFRVIFPITEAMDIADAISRKNAIQDYFSFGDKTYLDTSFLIKGRGFVVPIELDYFFEYESQNEKVLDLTIFAQGLVRVVASGEKIKAVEGMDSALEVEDLVKLYLSKKDDELVLVNGREYHRNDAFYKIHIEIAKYRVSEGYQITLAHRMNMDGKRNSVEMTVDNARKACRHIDISALRTKSLNYSVETKNTKYLQVEDVNIEQGKKHLLTATTGTGKTTLVLDKIDRKVIFAAPLNSIIEQQSLNRPFEVLTGTSGVLPTTEKILCSYDALIALLDKNDLSDYLIVLDEFHRVLSDGFRIDKMSGLLERLQGSNYTILCMSGTFDPTHLEWFKFDYHFDFKADRKIRSVQVLETTGKLDNALIRFLRSLKSTDNNLVLFDDKKKALAIQKVLPDITVISADSKEDEVYKQFLALEEIKGTVLTTQVLLEGINLKNLDNIVIVATKFWSEEQMVQLYERDRDRSSNCFLIRKPIKKAESYIPEAYKEKEYQNSFYREINKLGICKAEQIGAKDLDKLIRHEESEVYMNLLYPYWKQKAAMDIANFREGLQLEKYGYELIETVEKISSSSVIALDKVKNLSKEIKLEGYYLAVEKALEGERYSGEFSSTFNMIGILLENGFSKVEARDIASQPKELEAYKNRITEPLPTFEKVLYKKFKVGEFYSAIDAKAIITKAITNSPSTTIRVNPNHYQKLLTRYFHIKRKTTKKGVEIEAIRKIKSEIFI